MSEYQYYEFQAVDRPLTGPEMAELRAISTRARISPTRFQNVYHWGDLKGDPLAMVERFFDAFVYEANWGTHWLMLRLPRGLIDLELAQRYCDGQCLEVHTRPDHAIVDFRSDDEDSAGWVEDEASENWLPELLPLRAELAAGDPRCLYLAWLAGVQHGAFEDEVIEPPVPAGLGDLAAALETLAEFLRIDADLLEVAAEASPALQPSRALSDLAAHISALPAAEKDAFLLQLASGEPAQANLRPALLRRLGGATAWESAAGTRTVGQMLSAASERDDARRLAEAERQAAERVRLAREQAAARVAYLDSLVGREEELWRQVDTHIETKRPNDYDRAVKLLQDLSEISARQQSTEAFGERLSLLRQRNAKRPSLLERIDRAGLRS